jgi:hypothetical protein
MLRTRPTKMAVLRHILATCVLYTDAGAAGLRE